ncbi:MAG: hypothetical protein LUE10_07840 [Alistipes sp.]|nr:hypothetical protein [Alistipes sp.]
MIALFLSGAGSVISQDRITTAGFWNVENLYDTIPSLFYDDTDYTPQGRLGWDTKKYRNKISRICQVLDSLSLDIAGLAEVESEAVVRDLVQTLDTPYNYIRHTTGDSRGMGLALLYKGDKFVPDTSFLVPSGIFREFLYVRGELLGVRIDILVCHLPSRLNSKKVRERSVRRLASFTDSLLGNDPAAQLIVMGDFNCDPGEKPLKNYLSSKFPAPAGKVQIYSPFAEKSDKGYGTYAYRGRWSMSDNIYLSPGFFYGEGFTYFGCGIFIRPWLLDDAEPRRRGFPLRTFTYGKYRNGYSDHLPVYIVFG